MPDSTATAVLDLFRQDSSLQRGPVGEGKADGYSLLPGQELDPTPRDHARRACARVPLGTGQRDEHRDAQWN